MISDRIDSLARIELPPCFERVGGGVRVSGHRVSLHVILDAMADGATPERMEEMFPTIPAEKLAAVVAFCRRHPEAMREYREERRAAAAVQAGGRTGTAPTLAELRRRKAEGAGRGRRND